MKTVSIKNIQSDRFGECKTSGFVMYGWFFSELISMGKGILFKNALVSRKSGIFEFENKGNPIFYTLVRRPKI